MGQVSSKLRRCENGYLHWCPGCEEAHRLPTGWEFNGNLERPTFKPSFRHTGKKRVMVDGKWVGDWVRDNDGKAVDQVCHYFVTDGNLIFQGDCTHPLAGKTVPLPDLTPFMRDGETFE